MSALQRLATILSFGLLFGAFAMAPQWLHLDASGLLIRAVVAQMGGPLLAAIACFYAARRSLGSDRTAWYAFSAGSVLYLAGNLLYLFFSLTGIETVFPTFPEAAYFIMALVFGGGMFLYGKVRQQVTRVQVYNLILIYCAVILAALFLLNHALLKSVLPPFATSVAFLYPALWFSVAASGLISLVLYAHGGKAVAFALILAAVFCEAFADYQYALSLLDGTYEVGGSTQLLWVASAGLIVWAALEQAAIAGRVGPAMRRTNRGLAEASVPAATVAVILFSGTASGTLGNSPFVWLMAGLSAAFAVFSGLREHRIIDTQRQLRATVEANRAALEKSQARLTSVLESTSDSVLVLDRDWHVVYFNHRAVETADKGDQLHLGISLWELFPAATTSGEGAQYKRAVETGQPAEFEIFVEDRQVWLGIHAYPSQDGLSIFFRDISEEKRVRDELLHLATHDPLTGLANRTVFQDRLRLAVRERAVFAVILLDVDHFKEVNDTLGHSVGDALLLATAQRLRNCLRAEDLVARLGGDEFVVIADGAGAPEAALLAQRFLDAANNPHLIEGESIRLGSSMGIALSDGTEMDPDRIFRNADIALYAAKADTRGGFKIFEPQMEGGMQERQALRADLRVALENGQFEMAYQPLVDLRSERVCGFEALLRWRHPSRGMVPPDVFIPIAEESGMIIGIGNWALQTATAEAMKWPADVSVAVNLSTREFASDDLADNVAAALETSGLDAARLELEITETVLLKNSKANLETLHKLRGLGLRVALDDFGTGYSSLAYLQQFPFSKIKIDRSFISGLPRSDAGQAIVRSVIGLGMALGMRVTAEGVETREQYDWVKMGCNEAQGYFLSRPVAAHEVPGVIARLNSGDADTYRAAARLAG